MRIEKRYELLAEIGRGGMSVVYLAKDHHLGKHWAVKRISRQQLKQYGMDRSDVLREVELMKRLEHPGLPILIDFIEETDAFCLVMEYVKGETLAMYRRRQGALDEKRLCAIGIQLCMILQYLHEQKPPVLYLDMKPENVMYGEDGRVRLIDLGIATIQQHPLFRLGTKGYAPPEQTDPHGACDARSDIYALGMTLCYLLNEALPAAPSSLSSAQQPVSKSFIRILQRCIAVKPDDRYASCQILRSELEKSSSKRSCLSMNRRFPLPVFLLLLTSCTFWFIAIGGTLLLQQRTKQYQTYLYQGQYASDNDQRAQGWQKAIALQPEQAEPYLRLLELYRNDFCFSQAEELQLLTEVEQWMPFLPAAEQRRLKTEIGKLYWYYYEGMASDAVLRMQKAAPWFQAVAQDESGSKDLREEAKQYSAIAAFYQDIALKMTLGEDRGVYGDVWNELLRLHNRLTENASVDMQLQCDRLLVLLVEAHAASLQLDGISFAEQHQVLRQLRKEQEQALQKQTENQTITQLRKTLVKRLEQSETALLIWERKERQEDEHL